MFQIKSNNLSTVLLYSSTKQLEHCCRFVTKYYWTWSSDSHEVDLKTIHRNQPTVFSDILSLTKKGNSDENSKKDPSLPKSFRSIITSVIFRLSGGCYRNILTFWQVLSSFGKTRLAVFPCLPSLSYAKLRLRDRLAVADNMLQKAVLTFS